MSGLPRRASTLAVLVSAAVLGRPAHAGEEPSALVSRALKARDARDDATAIRLLEDAVALEPRPEWLGLLAETVAWKKDFARAESLYRKALAASPASPASRDLSLGLGRVLLWQGRYGEGRAVLEPLVRRDPRDAEALEELATGAYWSGDYRSAARDFRRVLALRPASPRSKKSLDEIASASRARWEVSAAGLTDDQPFRTLAFRGSVSVFSDPLTRWDLSAGGQALRAPGAADESGDAARGRLGVEAVVPSLRLTASGWLEALRAPDGATLGLWGATLKRSLGNAGALSLVADRREILATRASIADHPNVTRAGLSWTWERAHASAGAEAFLLRHFDGNRGVAASAWLLWPLFSAGAFRLSAGPALLYRDTDESRFVLAGASATPDPAGGYRYAWTGAYVPYWTPVGLKEGRISAVLEGPMLPGLAARLAGDAGWAEDEAGGFGPDAGPSPVPPAPYAFTYARSFHPWRVSASLALDLGSGARLEVRWAHETTAYYRSDAFHASVAGRF